MSATYNFDGKNFKLGSKIIANVRGDKICEGLGTNTIANIRGDKICQGLGSNTIATFKDVDKDIDGPGGRIKAALWFVKVR